MDMEIAREQMLSQQLRAWEVLDERVLEAVGSVPREAFVPPAYRDLAFADTGIPLGYGEEMVPPKLEGRALQALRLRDADCVLEVGTGSGFFAACLARLAGEVHSIDIQAEFVDAARARLRSHGAGRVSLEARDVFAGAAPGPGRFDAIAITGSLPVLDERFIQWLKPGGRLFVVVGEAPVMEALLIERAAAGEWLSESLFETSLPPLRNAPRPDRFRL